MARRLFVAAAAAAAALCALSCKRDPAPTNAPPPAATTPPTPTVSDPGEFAPSDPDSRVTPTEEDLHGTLELPVSETTVIPGQPATPPDPFEPAIASFRAGAVGCFSPLPPAEYAVVVDLFATPAGRVSRAEVQPGNVQDPQALACLKSYAESRTFPQTSGGRALHIEVRVKP